MVWKKGSCEERRKSYRSAQLCQASVGKTHNAKVFLISTEAACKNSINHLWREWKGWGKLAILAEELDGIFNEN